MQCLHQHAPGPTAPRQQVGSPHAQILHRLPLRQHSRRSERQRWQVQAVATGQNEEVASLLRSALSSTRSETTLTQRDCIEYLKSIGLSNIEEGLRVLDVATNPFSSYRKREARKGRSLPEARRLSVDDIRPVVEFLRHQCSLDSTRVCKIISGYPPILACDVPTHLQPLMTALQEAGLSDPVQAAAKRPCLLGLKPDGSLARIVGYFRANGKTQEEIAQLLETSV